VRLPLLGEQLLELEGRRFDQDARPVVSALQIERGRRALAVTRSELDEKSSRLLKY
jgi:hypothetical protein